MSENYNIIDDRPKKWTNGSCCAYCTHFHGIENETCEAYPDGGIPDRFAYSRDVHMKVEPDQAGNYIFTLKSDT